MQNTWPTEITVFTHLYYIERGALPERLKLWSQVGHRSSYLKVTARQPRDEAVDETAEVGAGEGVFTVAQVVDQILGQLGPYPHVRLAHLANEPVQVVRLLVRHPALFRRFSATVHTLSSRSTTPHLTTSSSPSSQHSPPVVLSP